MTTELRRSIFRMMADLIKSDEIITSAELDALDDAVRSFGISDADKECAHSMTMAQAVETIAVQSRSMKEKIRNAMAGIAAKDNECCRSEALILMLMDYLCDGQDVEVYSTRATNRSLLSSQLIYLEDKSSIRGLEVLDESFDEISNLVRIAGLELIYIPQIAKHFRRHAKQDDLRRLLALISPQSEEAEIENTLSAIKGMSTKFFYDNVIRGKLELGISISDPVWMLRIPDSNVAGTTYINLLCLKVSKDIRSQLIQLISKLNSRQGSYSVKANDGWGRESSFMYSGFYKALLDLMSVRKIDKWDMHIRLYGDGVAAYRCPDAEGNIKKYVMTIRKGSEEYPIPLAGRDVAFYLLLCCASAASPEAGLDFHDKSLAEITQVRYGQLFRAVSRRADEPLVWDPSFRVPMRSRISSAINDSQIAKQSSLQSLYLPAEPRRGMLRIGIEPDRIMIDSVNGSIPLRESALYRMYLHPGL